jgi:3-oxoacyl-[acyl-carrier protein] reductase
MDFGLKNKVAFVSGSSKGMGKAAAMIFAEEGAKVVITGRGKEAVNKTVDEIMMSTGNTEIIGIAGDLTSKEGVQSAIRQVVDKWGTVDIAISNVYGPQAEGFETVSEGEWHEAYQQQVMHVVYLTSEVIPYMKKNRWGRLININSISAKEPHRELPLVTANVVRPAVAGLQKSLAFELAPFGITVNTVLPGSIETERIKEYAKSRAEIKGVSSEEVQIGSWAKIPMNRVGTPREFSSVVVFLASEPAAYVTGVSVQVDGGRVRSLF